MPFDLRKSRRQSVRDAVNSKIVIDAYVEINDYESAIRDLDVKKHEYREEKATFDK